MLMRPFFTAGIALGVALIVGNLLFLNGYIFFVLPKQIPRPALVGNINPEETSPTTITSEDCGVECKNYIDSKFEILQKTVPTSLPKTVTPSPASTTRTSSVATVKEFFIPVGSGFTVSDQWEDILGTDTYIDTKNYSSIQTVYFEGSLRVPTKNGVVSARLYNVTDKHPVWFSEISTANDTSTFMGTKITLDPGNKLYRIQMKTTLRYQSFIDSGRVKIVLQ